MKGIHHVGITVPDLDRAIAFYNGVLGLEFFDPPSPVFDDAELGERVGLPGAALRQVNLTLGDSIVELIEYTAPAPPSERPVQVNLYGAAHLAFRVDDIEAVSAHLVANGVTMLSDEMDYISRKLRFFEGPEGITLELVEWVEAG